MSILSREQVLERLKAKIGDSTNDEDISLLEDFTETFDDLEKRTKDSTDWKAKYEENDAKWRQKYRDRFFSSEEPPKPDEPPKPEDKTEPLKYEDLYE